MALTIDIFFFVSFVEETIQTSHIDLSLSPRALVGNIPGSFFDAIRAVCTKLCLALFGDRAAKLKKKDEKNFLVVAKAMSVYSVYKPNSILYQQKNQALYKIYTDLVQRMFVKCTKEPQVFIFEENDNLYIHIKFDNEPVIPNTPL